MTHVLIAGAGPVGLTMATELARYGVSARVIDKAAGRSTTSKALVLWSRGGIWLARPDGYVAAVVRPGAESQVGDYLSGLA